MTNINFEFFLANISFVILFFLMILYWIQTIFYVIPQFSFIAFLTTMCANLAIFVLLSVRWFHYNHFPLSNLYESLLFLSWGFTFVQLVFLSSNLYSPLTATNTIIGTIFSPLALFTNSFATFSLPKTMQKAQALVPALQSNWLMMHVTVMMLSYIALLCGSLLSIVFLVIKWYEKKNITQFTSEKNENLSFLSSQSNSILMVTNSTEIPITHENLPVNELYHNSSRENVFSSKQTNSSSINYVSTVLDNLSYRILGIGFPLLTIGILSGAVWANEAWGSYWSWDPKETWAFITWLIFAIYLHARINKGWQGTKPAIIAGFGFFIVWICYLGVNLLGTGLHSYGWIK